MSLDVMLKSEEPTIVECKCSECDHVHSKAVFEYYYDANITHNLNKIAQNCGLYVALWRPENLNYKYARDLIAPLTEGIKRLTENLDTLRQYEPKNGWGTAENLLSFACEYRIACELHPDAEISVSR